MCQEATLVARSLIRLRHSLYKLDNGHSVECKLTPTTRSPEICFRTLWPCDLDLWPNIHWRARDRGGLFLVKPLWFYRADRQTDRQRDRITDADDRYTNETTVLHCCDNTVIVHLKIKNKSCFIASSYIASYLLISMTRESKTSLKQLGLLVAILTAYLRDDVPKQAHSVEAQSITACRRLCDTCIACRCARVR